MLTDICSSAGFSEALMMDSWLRTAANILQCILDETLGAIFSAYSACLSAVGPFNGQRLLQSLLVAPATDTGMTRAAKLTG